MNARARCGRVMREMVAYVRELLSASRPQAGQAPPVPPGPARAALPPASPWGAAWTTPTPAHVRERFAPLRGEDVALVRPYVLAEERRQHEAVRRELLAAGKERRLYVLV